MILDKGKINIILDGQFGSTGKGLLASYISVNNKIDISVSNCSANAGHTFYYKGNKCVVRHIPVSGIINDNSIIYFSSNAVINVDVLLKEISEYDINIARVFIHPRCAIITDDDVSIESDKNSPVFKIASTMSGVGEAVVRKIRRESSLAAGEKRLKNMVCGLNLQEQALCNNTILVETSQGLDLSINTGLLYPYCTSKEITVSSTLSDVQVHPSYLGKVCVSIRTFPIRVGNICNGNKVIGYSGPFYDDSREIDWADICVNPEFTSITKRERRIATFSYLQYNRMIELYKPDYLLLNFANYLDHYDLNSMLNKLKEVTHLGFGPKIGDIYCKD